MFIDLARRGLLIAYDTADIDPLDFLCMYGNSKNTKQD